MRFILDLIQKSGIQSVDEIIHEFKLRKSRWNGQKTKLMCDYLFNKPFCLSSFSFVNFFFFSFFPLDSLRCNCAVIYALRGDILVSKSFEIAQQYHVLAFLNSIRIRVSVTVFLCEIRFYGGVLAISACLLYSLSH